jgi:hypothetical protein
MPYLVGAGWGYEALEISTIVDNKGGPAQIKAMKPWKFLLL